jgi:hypothetical protein
MLKRLAALALALSACAAPQPPVTPPAPAAAAPPAIRASISADDLRRDLHAFAADSFRGRAAGTPDALRAARFIADRLQRLGVEPAGDSGYFHRVPLSIDRVGPGTQFSILEGTRRTRLVAPDDLLPVVTLGPGAYGKLSAAGEMVFAGYGVTLPAVNRDDFARLDVSGKVVVVVAGAPAGVDSATRIQLESQEGWALRLQRLLPLQPAAVIILLQGEGATFYEKATPVLMRTMSTVTGALPDESQRQFPMIMLGLPKAGSPLLPSGWPNDDLAQPLTGRRFEGRVELTRTMTNDYNVVGVIPGSDARLRESYVALGAHYDHVGVGEPVAGDSIYNGADDDGSGTVALLAIARSLSEAPVKPRRSLLFVWHAAEEAGLIGSAHFTANPTVPIDSIVAHVNADMIGRNHPDSVYIVGPGAAPGNQSRAMGAVLDSVNATRSRPFAFNREWDTPTHPERIYFRSDHFHYATKGIPIVFFTTGLHDDYHKPSDSADKIDYAKLTRLAELIHDFAVTLANREGRLSP